MDSLIMAAAEALAAGDALAALALRGIAIAQLGDLARTRGLLRSAARNFGSKEATARARCVLAEAEIALVSRSERGNSMLRSPRADAMNAAHAAYLIPTRTWRCIPVRSIASTAGA